MRKLKHFPDKIALVVKKTVAIFNGLGYGIKVAGDIQITAYVCFAEKQGYVRVLCDRSGFPTKNELKIRLALAINNFFTIPIAHQKIVASDVAKHTFQK